MTIRVLRRHIKAGKQKKCRRCPIAIAMKEQTKEAWSITPEHARLISNNARLRLPVEVTNFIVDFDNGGEVSPFTFKITLQND